jgi:hypothetical protein
MSNEPDSTGCPPDPVHEGKCAHSWPLHERLDEYGNNPAGFVEALDAEDQTDLIAAFRRRGLPVSNSDEIVLNNAAFWPPAVRSTVIGFITAAERPPRKKFSIIHCHGSNVAVKVLKDDRRSTPSELHLRAAWERWISDVADLEGNDQTESR